MKKLKLVGMLTLLILGMTACKTEEAPIEKEEKAVNSLTLFEDGSIESVIIEDFAESYYNVNDLNQMIQETITVYQKEAPDAKITLESCELIEQQVKVVLKYNSAEAYSGYNQETLFVGTVQEAYSEGYDLNMTLTGTDKDATKITRDGLLNESENHIMILENTIEEGTLRVNCYDKILYAGDGVTPIEKKKADVIPTQGFSVIVFK